MSGEDFRSLVERLERIERKLEEASQQPRVVKIEEAARLLSCSPRHVSRKIKQGKLKVVFPLDLKRVRMSEIIRITSMKDDPESAPTIGPKAYDAQAEAEEARARAKKRRKR